MKKLLVFFPVTLAFLFCSIPAQAQSLVVPVCGTLPLAYSAGSTRSDTVDVNGNKCISGGSAATIADGADVTQGAKADAAGATGSQTVISILKQLHLDVTGSIPAGSNNIGTVFAAGTGPATIATSVPIVSSSQYPGNATAAANPITGNATGSTGAVVGTLANAASKTTFICGFNVSAIGGVATIGPITVAGLVGSSQVYQVPVNSAAGQILTTQNFNPCIPASAVNTAITVTTTADGTATAVDVNSWGYQL